MRTLKRKGGNDTPLLETGALRDSIGIKLYENRGIVGTNNEVAPFHEFGTSKMSPRPFMLPSALLATGQIEKSAKKYIGAALAGRGMHATGLHELLRAIRLLIEVAREVHRIGKSLTK